MLIYNVSIKVDHTIELEWLHWMKTKHIPEVMNTKQFVESHICRLIDPAADEGGITFIVQYRCESMEKLNFYFENFAPSFREDFNSRYQDRTTLFRTVMEILQ
jgi:hypothetical protein